MKTARDKIWLALLNQASVVLFGLVLVVFACTTPGFFTVKNLANIALQAAPTAVVAFGMTFVLLTAGVDLSVGAIMFLTAVCGGKLMLAGYSLWVVLPVMIGLGAGFGGLNAVLITRLGIIAFVATLGTFYIGRGAALWVSRTRAMNLPPEFLSLGSGHVLGIPVPILVCVVVLFLSHWVLSRTAFGRQIYAVGHRAESARQAGINTAAVLAATYVICGALAAIGAILTLGQLGAVSPTFGMGKEFAAIAAAVLGGTSLFGGRGQVFPGTLLGALLIQTVENGLVIRNEDPYFYPLITSAIIFIAVLTDSVRTTLLARLNRRVIRLDTAS
jgi:ribose transport system permease protein